MNSPAFDTHHAVKMLEKAGAEEPLAEAVVATIGVAITASVASKADVKELGRELSGRMDGVERGMGGIRKDLTGRMDAIKRELLEDMDRMKRELLEEMNEVKRELSGRMDGFERDLGDIRKEMKILEHRITIRLGLMMLGGFSLLAVLIKL